MMISSFRCVAFNHWHFYEGLTVKRLYTKEGEEKGERKELNTKRETQSRRKILPQLLGSLMKTFI